MSYATGGEIVRYAGDSPGKWGDFREEASLHRKLKLPHFPGFREANAIRSSCYFFQPGGVPILVEG